MRHKKRHIIEVVLLLLIAAAVPPLAIWWHRIFPSHEVSELYSRYENVDGVEASFVKDFQVNDTIVVDVTLLEATDSAGWRRLKEEFDIIEAEDLPPDEREIFNVRFSNSIEFKKAAPGKYNQKPDTNVCNNDAIIYEREGKRVCVFHTANNDNQYNVIVFIVNLMMEKQNINFKK